MSKLAAHDDTLIFRAPFFCLGDNRALQLTEMLKAGGFFQVRRATETPFNMVLEARS
jgi:hypothetical protein